MDLSYRRPFHHSVNDFSSQRSNDFQLGMSKGIPCHVTAIDKDMVTVAFDTKNSVWTPPNMKMPQAFSTYGRDPTRVGDKGYAVPSDYQLGGNSGLGGGVADYSPRGNLTALVFHPMSNTGNESRDYDQLTHSGGKNGVMIRQGPPAQPSSNNGVTPASFSRRRLSPTSAAVLRHSPGRLGRLMPALARAALADSNPQPADQSFIQIDKDGVISHSSKSKDHVITVDESNSRIAVQVPSQNHIVYLGGSGKKQSLYAPVLCGGLVPSVNVWAKVVQEDD